MLIKELWLKIDAKTEKDDKALQKILRTPKTILQHQHFFAPLSKGKHFPRIFHRLTETHNSHVNLTLERTEFLLLDQILEEFNL